MEITTIQPFLEYWERIRQRTVRVVERIPPDQIEWSYREGKFTFGDLVRHLGAMERYMFAENACRRASRYPGHGKELAEGFEAVLRFLSRMHTESMEIFSGLTDEDLQQKCRTPGRSSMAVWKWLRAMIEHEVHHRGQIYLYLAILGVATPPLYGLTSEEVLERSVEASS